MVMAAKAPVDPAPVIDILRKELIRMAAFQVDGQLTLLANGGTIKGVKPRFVMKKEYARLMVPYQRAVTPAEQEVLDLVALMIPTIWADRVRSNSAQMVIHIHQGVPDPDFEYEPYFAVS